MRAAIKEFANRNQFEGGFWGGAAAVCYWAESALSQSPGTVLTGHHSLQEYWEMGYVSSKAQFVTDEARMDYRIRLARTQEEKEVLEHLQQKKAEGLDIPAGIFSLFPKQEERVRAYEAVLDSVKEGNVAEDDSRALGWLAAGDQGAMAGISDQAISDQKAVRKPLVEPGLFQDYVAGQLHGDQIDQDTIEAIIAQQRSKNLEHLEDHPITKEEVEAAKESVREFLTSMFLPDSALVERKKALEAYKNEHGLKDSELPEAEQAELAGISQAHKQRLQREFQGRIPADVMSVLMDDYAYMPFAYDEPTRGFLSALQVFEQRDGAGEKDKITQQDLTLTRKQIVGPLLDRHFEGIMQAFATEEKAQQNKGLTPVAPFQKRYSGFVDRLAQEPAPGERQVAA